MTDYKKCAEEIYEILGGKENLIRADHCATRLRIATRQNEEADMEKLEHVDGVKGVFSNNGQIHLILGPDAVTEVYDEFLKVSGLAQSSVAEKEAAKDPSAFQRVIRALGDVF